ncbi:unnamed protein product [Psylliodes chrysocephalus]|uniref:Cuticle protein n=1 Tax=Psylliodes chrysocephalus TaxID=3402493 RepID=A0A9P0CM96_9CUCU|nr:unnamed protein product [Psylliodes chrysocephala]
MKTLGPLFFIHAVSLATAGIIPSSNIIEGPSSKTTLVGPDGSVITSVQQGAKIVTDGHSALVAAPDTEAILKEADHTPVVQPLLTPVAEVKQFVPHGIPVQVIGDYVPTHTAYLKSEPLLSHHVGTKTTISEHSQSVAHPVPLVKSHLAVDVSPVIEAKAHLEPIIETHAVPAIATKTTIYDYSQTNSHPTVVKSIEPVHLSEQAHYVAPAIAVEARHVAPAVRIEAHHVAPVETYHVAHALASETNHATQVALEAHHPALSVETYHVAPAFAAPLVESHHVAPVITKQVPSAVPVIGTKTTISEQSQSIVHPVEAKAVISEAVPVVTANLVKEQTIPIVAHHAIPVIGTETRISENAQTVVSHSW